MSVIKAKTSPTGYVAQIRDSLNNSVEFPVARFDDEGYAMVCNDRGVLVRANGIPNFLRVWPMLQANGR